MKRHSPSELAVRRERALVAAREVFFRHGYAKTTIGDIAAAAGLHRPALYALCPGGKDDLFETVLLRYVDDEIATYRVAIRRFRSTRRRIAHCVEAWTVGGLRWTLVHPASNDAFDPVHGAVRRMYDVLTAFYAELLRDDVARSTLRISAEDVARLLVFSVRGLRVIADDEATLRRLIYHELDVLFAALTPR